MVGSSKHTHAVDCLVCSLKRRAIRRPTRPTRPTRSVERERERERDRLPVATSVTGYSSADVAISEKVWLHYTGSYTYEGIPTDFLLRQILQFATNLADAEARVKGAFLSPFLAFLRSI